jgi:hypothetical protein
MKVTMIANIIDRRKRRYRWKKINAVIEPTYHDIDIDDADQIDVPSPGFPIYDRRLAISVADAIAWATEIDCPVTLFLYDLAANI